MEVILNGRKLACEQGCSLAEILEAQGFRREHIAVERNGEIIPKSQYEACLLTEADTLEIVTFVGGG